MSGRSYVAIDLKSFYASVECVERGLDPLTTNLVVADASRTQKTICLAVSPALKKQGISGRPRLFEVVQQVETINASRRMSRLKEPPLTYITVPPRMSLYIQYSAKIYNVYLKYIAPEDIHIYSIDEVFMDVTDYLATYRMTPKELATAMIQEVLETTGITATAGIGTNLYLCKVAMDIVAKRIQPDKDGVRIAQLDEQSYRELLWNHKPLTDFWRVGKGYAKRLEACGLYTMGDIARCSIGQPRDFYNEELLYKMFGINAELLIDHAWGWEPCTMTDIKGYKPQAKSIGSGQVLVRPYTFVEAKLVVKEMVDSLTLDLVEKGFVTNQIVLTVGYDIENLSDPLKRSRYKGEIKTDSYGRQIPKHAHGTENIKEYTASTRKVTEAVCRLYDRIVDPHLLIRRLSISANHIKKESEIRSNEEFEQLSLFTDYEAQKRRREEEDKMCEKEKRVQQAMLSIKRKYGKNAVLKGMNFEEGATAKERNRQIGGHKA